MSFGASRIRGRRRLSSIERAAVALVGVVAIALPSLLGFDANYDQHNYHVLSGTRVLRGEWFDPLDLGLASLNNPLVNVPYAFAVVHLPSRAVSLIFSLIAASVVFPLLAIVRLLLPGNARTLSLQRAFALLISLSGPMWLSELGTSFADAVLLPFTTASLWLVLRGRKVGNVANLIIGFALMGAVTGLKQTFAPFALALIIAAVTTEERKVGSLISTVLSSGLSTLVGFVITGGAWLLELWSRFRNPVFPYFNAFFRSPYFRRENWWDSRFDQRSIAKIVSLPFRLVIGRANVAEAPIRDPRWFLVIVAFVATAGWSWRRRGESTLQLRADPTHADRVVSDSDERVRAHVVRPWFGDLDMAVVRMLVIFTICGYALWAWQFGIARYALPSDVLSGLFLLIPIHALAGSTRDASRWLALALLIGLLGSRPSRWGTVPYDQSPYRRNTDLAELNAGSFLVLGTTEPSAYFAAEVPAGVRFVRTGFLFPHGSLRMNELEAETQKASASTGLWLLGVPADGDWLRSIGLTEDAASCRQIPFALIPNVRLCRWSKT
jgi:hypothetical protein